MAHPWLLKSNHNIQTANIPHDCAMFQMLLVDRKEVKNLGLIVPKLDPVLTHLKKSVVVNKNRIMNLYPVPNTAYSGTQFL
jgi:hypothetical protein